MSLGGQVIRTHNQNKQYTNSTNRGKKPRKQCVRDPSEPTNETASPSAPDRRSRAQAFIILTQQIANERQRRLLSPNVACATVRN